MARMNWNRVRKENLMRIRGSEYINSTLPDSGRLSGKANELRPKGAKSNVLPFTTDRVVLPDRAAQLRFQIRRDSKKLLANGYPLEDLRKTLADAVGVDINFTLDMLGQPELEKLLRIVKELSVAPATIAKAA